MKTHFNTKKIVLVGLLAAITCLSTKSIRIPTTKGYIHIGDSIVILSSIILGPLLGGLAASIGSFMADILAGYYMFAFATLIIKFIAAFGAGFMFKAIKNLKHLPLLLKVIIAGITSEILVILGYFVFEIFYEGFAIALLEILPNASQGIMGIILSSILCPILLKIPAITNEHQNL